MAALFLAVKAGLLLAFILFILLHHAVAFADVRYANHMRVVTPVEQMVHSFLEILPITAFLLIAGPGVWALDAIVARRLGPPSTTALGGRALPASPSARPRGGRTVRPIGG